MDRAAAGNDGRQGRGAPPVATELRLQAVIAAPLAAAYIAEMAMNVTDTLVVGRLGTVELAAVGLAANILFGVLFVCMGVVTLVGVLVAQAHGGGDRAAAGRAVRQGLWVATALSLPAMLLGWHMAPVLRWLGQDEQVVAIAEQYLRAVLWCFLPYMYFTVLRNFVAALARANAIMVITVASVGLNFALVYCLVFGRLGLPALGVAGAGYGTSIVCWAMLLALVAHILRSPALAAYRVFDGLMRVDAPLFAEIMRHGWPVAGIAAVENTLFQAVAVLMGVISVQALAANQIAFSFITIVFMIPYSIGQAATLRVAHGIGAGSAAAARQAGYLALGLGAGYMVVMGLAMWLFARPIAGLYLDAGDPANGEAIALATVLLGIAALFQVADGTQMIAAGALRGLKDTQGPFLIGLVGYWGVGLGSGWLLAFPLGYGARGLWWGLALGLAAAAVLLTLRFHSRTRALVAAEPAPATA